MSILSWTDIIPEQLSTNLIVDQQQRRENERKRGTGRFKRGGIAEKFGNSWLAIKKLRRQDDGRKLESQYFSSLCIFLHYLYCVRIAIQL